MIHISKIGVLALAGLVGCQAEQVADYDRPLGPGECALKKLEPSQWPSLQTAYATRDAHITAAIDQSVKWFQAPSSERSFPYFELASHEQAGASLIAFRSLLSSSTDAAEFNSAMQEMFDCYQTIGYNRKGVVLFTGYYAPEFRGSRTQQGQFQYPLYRRPPDLVTDPVTGEPRGRQMPDGSLAPWPGRAELEATKPFAGTELVWLTSPLDTYIIQVNGSAKIILDDGKIMFIGYAGKTDGAYVGLGETLVNAGIVKEAELSLPKVRECYTRNPAQVTEFINQNNCYVFFTDYDGRNWPAGSLGVRVTERETLATDKKVYPPGGIVLVETQAISTSKTKEPFNRFMLDQDTGGAIRAPGRADIFMGVGLGAEILAGGQYAEGTMYYFFLKPEFVSQYPLPVKEKQPATKGTKPKEPVASRAAVAAEPTA